MTSAIVKVGMVSLLCATAAGAQSNSAVRLQLAPGTQLTFEGTSTLHGFKCTTTAMQAYIDVDQSYKSANLGNLDHPIVAVQVVIPVRSLSCGGELENNMRKTLNAEKFPYIIYKMSTYNIVSGTASASAFTAATEGQLTIAGKENPVTLTVKASRDADGKVTATGSQTIGMKDFGIKPPTFMLGTLRVGNELKINFTINATSASVASAMTELGGRMAGATVARSALTHSITEEPKL